MKEGEGMYEDTRTIEELIREEAYFVWKTREKYNIPGTPKGDWIDAERKIQHRLVEDVISKNVKGRLEGGY
jgi:hypothetical protein